MTNLRLWSVLCALFVSYNVTSFFTSIRVNVFTHNIHNRGTSMARGRVGKKKNRVSSSASLFERH